MDKKYASLYCLSKSLVETGESIINYGSGLKKEGKDAYSQAETMRKNYINEQKEQKRLEKESMKTASQPVFKGGKKAERVEKVERVKKVERVGNN